MPMPNLVALGSIETETNATKIFLKRSKNLKRVIGCL